MMQIHTLIPIYLLGYNFFRNPSFSLFSFLGCKSSRKCIHSFQYEASFTEAESRKETFTAMDRINVRMKCRRLLIVIYTSRYFFSKSLHYDFSQWSLTWCIPILVSDTQLSVNDKNPSSLSSASVAQHEYCLHPSPTYNA